MHLQGPGLPAHVNLWGCLLFTAWIASFGAYIGIRAAKTIDRHSNIFAYQAHLFPYSVCILHLVCAIRIQLSSLRRCRLFPMQCA